MARPTDSMTKEQLTLFLTRVQCLLFQQKQAIAQLTVVSQSSRKRQSLSLGCLKLHMYTVFKKKHPLLFPCLLEKVTNFNENFSQNS